MTLSEGKGEGLHTRVGKFDGEGVLARTLQPDQLIEPVFGHGAAAIRRLVHAIGGKKKKSYVLEIIEDRHHDLSE